MAGSEAASQLSLFTYVVVSAVIFVISYWSLFRRKDFDEKTNPPVTKSNWPIVGDLGFWHARHDWWRAALSQTKSANFSFHIGRHRAVGTNSDEGRKLYFDSKDLGFGEGYVAFSQVTQMLTVYEFSYAVLFGQAPDVADDEISGTEGGTQYFNQRMTALVKKDRLAKGESAPRYNIFNISNSTK